MGEELKILILEDVQFDAELMEYEMRREGVNFQSRRVETEEDFTRAITESTPDVILVDHSLPSFDGISALEIAQQNSPNTPFIFVSGKIGDEFAVDVLKRGATDYVFKNNLSKLVPAVERALKEREELFERKRAEEELKKAYSQMEVRVEERTTELNRSLEEKDVLLREIHHRVKNNLQIVSSLLSLQSRYIEDPKYVEIFKDSQSRIKSMALIHEKLYQTGNLTRIKLAGYVHELVRDLFRSYGVNFSLVQFNINCSDHILLDINTAIPCGLIINELVTNSIKHAFPGDTAGEINIDLKCQGDDFIITVQDNGVGFPEGLELDDVKTLGLQLVISLTSQLDGSIELEKEGGSCFTVKFKESECW